MDKRNPVKNILRIALPPLAEWADSTRLAYVWIDRQGRVARAGELAAAEIAGAFHAARAQVVLHPHDVIVAMINVPAVPANRYAAAVRGTLEGLILGDLDTLAIGHSKRAADGTAIAAWTPRDPLRDAWQRLSAAGLSVQAFYPLQLWSETPVLDQPEPLRSDDDPRWLTPNPGWSLAAPQLAPRQRSRWRATLGWIAGAMAIWIVGLNLYAAQLKHETQQLKDRMERDVRDAFPDIPVILDPVRQAQQGRDALRTGQGGTTGTDLLSLARIAAHVLPFAADAVDLFVYQNNALTLTLHDGNQDPDDATLVSTTGPVNTVRPSNPGDRGQSGARNTPRATSANTDKRQPSSTTAAASSAPTTATDRVADTAAILQRASALGARVERDDKGAWRITRVEP